MDLRQAMPLSVFEGKGPIRLTVRASNSQTLQGVGAFAAACSCSASSSLIMDTYKREVTS
eukprot:scaffold212896_cov18-Tisochrysis_lutea.AAC.2